MHHYKTQRASRVGRCHRWPEASPSTEAGSLQTNKGSGRWCQTKREPQRSPGTRAAHCRLPRSLWNKELWLRAHRESISQDRYRWSPVHSPVTKQAEVNDLLGHEGQRSDRGVRQFFVLWCSSGRNTTAFRSQGFTTPWIRWLEQSSYLHWTWSVYTGKRHFIKKRMTFSTGRGFSLFTVMLFQLCKVPATFERLMGSVLRGLTYDTYLIYMDDVTVIGRTFKEQINNLWKVLQRLRQTILKLNLKKCQLSRKDVRYLVHIVSPSGITTDPEKQEAVDNWTRPIVKHQLRRFLGLPTYYRRFISIREYT